jgi:hypothetical protein
MKCQCVATFGFPRPRAGLTGKGYLLATKPRLVTEDGSCAALALKAMAHRDARWFVLDRKVKPAAAAGGASGNHEELRTTVENGTVGPMRTYRNSAGHHAYNFV